MNLKIKILTLNLSKVDDCVICFVAEQQMQHYPDLTRGLVAVMLYYDGRKSVCDTLCLLSQARRGVSWEFPGPCDNRLIAAYMDQLVSNNLVGNILGAYFLYK